MKPRRALRYFLILGLFALLLVACQSCAPAATKPSPSQQATSPQEAPRPTQPSAAAQPTAAARPTTTRQIAPAEPTTVAAEPTATPPAQPTTAAATAVAPTGAVQPTPISVTIEGRRVELEWPSRLRLGESDVIRLALIPVKEGFTIHAEFPNHDLQTREVPIPRPNGYELYAVARLDGTGFDISPTGDQSRFIPTGEEVAWRWVLSPRRPGQQRLSVQLNLRWEPGPGVTGAARESQAYARGLDVQVTSFLGLSPTQAAATGLVGLLLGCGCMLAAVIFRREPLALPGARKAVQTVTPNPALAIEMPAGLALSPEENGLLRGLFGRYARLVIENEFLSGYSGARTFLVRPIRADGCADAPTIVKLGSRESICQEYENYDTFVKDRLPPMTARIQRPPVMVGSGKDSPSRRAAVQYTFIAEPGHPPVSLRQALLQTPDAGLLLRLFETFGPSWWMQRRPYTFRLGLEYDRLLPPHYVLEPARPAAGAVLLSETTGPAGLDLQPGALVSLQPFRQRELRADGRSYSLVGVPVEGHPALRLRWLHNSPPSALTTARVVSTRMDLLRGWTVNFARFDLPDPLACLPDVLEETVMGTRSVIHGDLNLENILAGPGSLVWLIDFAQTREGHPLFDLAHLASEIIAHILAPRAGSPRAYLDLWQSGSDPLLAALRQIAGRCLFDPARPREYDLALCMACLGALKYPNLPALAKHCLYLTAADLMK